MDTQGAWTPCGSRGTLSRDMRSHLYKVSFEGKWQESFEDLEDALDWGREVGRTGRLVHVADRGILTTRLLAVYPESRDDEGRRLWRVRSAGAS